MTAYPTAIAHVLAALRELEAARRTVGYDEPTHRTRIFEAQTYATLALDGLRHAYEATQETVPERHCECGHPLYLGTCVRCWARKELGVRNLNESQRAMLAARALPGKGKP